MTTVHYTEQEPFTLLQKTVYTDHRQSPIFKSGHSSSPELSAGLQDISSEMRSLPLCNLARLLERAPSGNTSAHVTYKPGTLQYSLEFGRVFGDSVKCVTAETVVGVTLGLLYKDLDTLERYIYTCIFTFSLNYPWSRKKKVCCVLLLSDFRSITKGHSRLFRR